MSEKKEVSGYFIVHKWRKGKMKKEGRLICKKSGNKNRVS